jgi:quercetin dioxygenase-like cupin family protein
MHDTNTVDYLLALAGGGELQLDDGFHPFEEGDVIILAGHVHGWRIGPDGCLMSCVNVPIPPS